MGLRFRVVALPSRQGRISDSLPGKADASRTPRSPTYRTECMRMQRLDCYGLFRGRKRSKPLVVKCFRLVWEHVFTSVKT